MLLGKGHPQTNYSLSMTDTVDTRRAWLRQSMGTFRALIDYQGNICFEAINMILWSCSKKEAPLSV